MDIGIDQARTHAVDPHTISRQFGGQALIELSTGNQPEQRLLAKISYASVARLNIEPGLALWAQIKAVALLV